jgi:Nif-specific regulatory protein
MAERMIAGRFRLQRKLGSGSSGEVFLARTAGDDRSVAVKIFQAGSSSEENIRAFGQEFALLSRLEHPSIVKIYDYGQIESGQPYFVMEYVEGPHFDAALVKKLPLKDLYSILVDICLGLEYLHEYGLIHQDIKPDNILLSVSSSLPIQAKLSDFGLAAVIGSGDARQLSGTLEYFSPEAIRGAQLDRRADLYSLGVTLYEVLTGKNPFRSKDPRQILKKHLETKPDSLKTMDDRIPAALENIVFRLLEKDPLDRFPAAASVVAALREQAGYTLSKEQQKVSGLLPPSRFVGRDRELGRLKEWSRQAQSGKPVVVFLQGKHGIGKTRLLKEFTIHCQLEGTAVLGESWLNRFFPVRDKQGRGIRPDSGDYQNWELICRQISQFSCAPVLIIEDLETADPRLLDFLEYLFQRLSRHSVFICCSYDAARLGAADSARLGSFKRGQRKGSVHSLTLRPLSRKAVTEILRSRLRLLRDLEELADVVYRSSGGNPCHVDTIVSALVDQNVLYYRTGSWLLQRERLEAVDFPRILGDIDRPRTGKISRAVKDVLKAAAVFGDSFRPENISPLVSTGGPMLYQRLAEALRAGWLVRKRPPGEPEALYSFSHSGLRESLYGSISSGIRAGWHRRLARQLEKEPKGGRDHTALAEHFRRGQVWGKAAYYALLAARQAMDSSRPETALSLFSQALAAGEKLQKPPAVTDILEGRGDACALTGRYSEALQAYNRALSRLGKRGSRRRLEIMLKKAVLFRRQSRYDEALATLDEGLDLAGSSGLRLQRARLLAEKGWAQRMKAEYQAAEETLSQALNLLRWQKDRADTARVFNSLGVVTWTLGRYQESQAYYERSLKIYQELGDQDRIAALLDNLGLAHLAQGHLERAIEHFQESLHLRKTTADVFHEAKACHNLAMALAEAGQWEEAISFYQQSRVIKERIGDLDGLALTLNNVGIIYMHQGLWEEARRSQEQALEIRTRLKDRYGLAGSHDNLGDLARLRGRWKEAGQHYRQACEIREKINDRSGLCHSQLNLGRLHLDQDHLRQAQTFLAASRTCFQDRQDLMGRMHADAALCELWLARGDLEKAQQHGQQALSQAAVGGNRFVQAQVRRVLGMAEMLSGDEPAAERLLIRSAEDAQALQARHELAKTYFYLGLVKQKGASPRQAVRHYREALMLFQRLGVRRFMSKIEEQLRQLETTLEDQESSELFTLYTMSQILNSLRDVDVLLEKVLDLAIELLHAERGAVILYQENQDEFEIKVARSMEKETLSDALQISRSTVKSVTREGKPMVVDNALQDKQFNKWQSVTMYNIMSILCVPLSIKGKLIGTIYLDNRTVPGIFSARDVSFLESFSNLTAVAIENARMYQELHGQNVYLKGELQKQYQHDSIVGNSRIMQDIFNIIDRVSPTKANVLVLGESGTGKELVARLIHYSSPRREQPFLKVNCAALTESLLESELFGIEERVATGVKSRKGKFELADGGTIFLDEIGDMSLSTQAKVLRVLQEREFERVGGSKTIQVNVRILSATNQDLESAIAERLFRKDLFYRLNTVAIRIPPLRERKEDIPFLVDHFIQKYCRENERDVIVVSPEVMEAFMKYHWPGNVRELENVVQRGVVMAEGKAFPIEYVPAIAEHEGQELTVTLPGGQAHLADVVGLVERTLIEKTLQEHGSVQLKAAKALGISESALRYKMKKYGIGK